MALEGMEIPIIESPTLMLDTIFAVAPETSNALISCRSATNI